MNRLSCLLALATFVSVGMSGSGVRSQTESSYSWLHQTLGMYSGNLTYDGGSDTVLTEFFLEDTGALVGSFALIGSFTPEGENQLLLGALSECISISLDAFVVRCQWQDRNAIGYAEWTLSEDFNAFEGEWWVKGYPEKRFFWSGSRLQNLPQVQITD